MEDEEKSIMPGEGRTSDKIDGEDESTARVVPPNKDNASRSSLASMDSRTAVAKETDPGATKPEGTGLEATDSPLAVQHSLSAVRYSATAIQQSVRPQLNSRGYTDYSTTLPALKRKETRMMRKEAHPMEHLGITLGLPAIILFDIVVPCIIYYTWYNHKKGPWERECREQHNASPQTCPIPRPQYDKDILGYAIISFGFGELWILIARVWRLFVRPEQCAPLLSRNKWELDATSWVYAVAMLVALIPFVIGSSLVKPHLYLYGPSCLMGFLGILMVVTTCHPFKIPIGINSHARGTGLRPFIYYAAEDFIAVDGLQDREFRIRYNERYESNKAFRRMFLYLTLWWILGVATYIGCVSAVIWTLPFHYAFGLSLGVLFAYIACWAGTSYLYVKWEIAKEHKVFEEGRFKEDHRV